MPAFLKLLVLGLLALAALPAWAYLDPGQISLGWQALVAALAAAGAMGSVGWTKLRSLWSRDALPAAPGAKRIAHRPLPRRVATPGRAGGSFRDPAAAVFEAHGRVFRGVSASADASTRALLASDFLERHAGAGVVATQAVDAATVQAAGLPPEDVARYPLWLEHECVDLISYPYEWSFEQLKQAALLHLGLHIDALVQGFDMKDASAYNVQFVDSQPVFIDTMSFVPYQEGAHWTGYKQFCEQFLNPLVLRAVAGVEFHAWYRGALEGIDTVSLARLLPWRSALNPALLANVHLHARAIAQASASTGQVGARPPQRPLPKKNYLAHLRSLQRCIAGLHPRGSSYWQDYATHTSYSAAGSTDKDRCIETFVRQHHIGLLLDIGCNTGHFSEIALAAGVHKAVGIDVDPGALDLAARRAAALGLAFTPLRVDITNPSPAIGWNAAERSPLATRLFDMDASICLALVHHIVIGRNVPMDEFVAWLVGVAPLGLVEFVPKDDPMVAGLLVHREDVFPDYDEAHFVRALEGHARILDVQALQDSSRKLFSFARSA